MGAGIGLLYDILRPARRHSGAALARLLEQDFGCQVVTGYVDSGNNVFDFE